MSTNSLADSGWVDIVPPVATSTAPDAAMVILTVVTVLIIAITVAWFYSTRPKQQARRKLRSLIRATALDEDQRRDSCHVIARELGKVLGVARLSAVCFADARQDRWQEFLQQLDQNRFSPEPVSGEDLTQLADQALSWLGRP